MCWIPWLNCAVLCVKDDWKRQSWGPRFCLSKLRSLHSFSVRHDVTQWNRSVKLRVYRALYLLTSWSRVLLEKLTGLQLVKKFPAFYGTRRFITAFTYASHLSLSWVSPIQSISLHPTSWRSILILSSLLHLAGLTTLPRSCADCHEIWEPRPPGTLRACQGL
jgi:hypothetical protein